MNQNFKCIVDSVEKQMKLKRKWNWEKNTLIYSIITRTITL